MLRLRFYSWFFAFPPCISCYIKSSPSATNTSFTSFFFYYAQSSIFFRFGSKPFIWKHWPCCSKYRLLNCIQTSDQEMSSHFAYTINLIWYTKNDTVICMCGEHNNSNRIVIPAHTHTHIANLIWIHIVFYRVHLKTSIFQPE